jgi:hypothetical protein
MVQGEKDDAIHTSTHLPGDPVSCTSESGEKDLSTRESLLDLRN